MSTTDALVLAVLALQVATLISSRKGGGLTRRARRRDEYAARAVGYAEKVGGSGPDKLRHALEAFRALDEADNKRRDYSDKEARLAIEAHLGAASLQKKV